MPGLSGEQVLEPGAKFDSYEILSLLARGGMANVWLGRQRMQHGLETLVAIKTILPDYSAEPQFQNMFLDEARIACRIDHPNVAKLLDVGETNGHSYIVMEYVGGESLSRLRKTFAKAKSLVPLNVAIRVMADLCAGLHAAHELEGSDGHLLNVIHRDVSPQNVLLSDAGVVKLIDFGVAKARGRLGGETSAGFAKGKVRYMAPEQAGGLDIDRRADIWAVGAVLYELLSGNTPVEGPNDMAVMKNLLTDAPIAPLPKDVPIVVQRIVHRALSYSPEARFSSASAMRDALEDAMVELRLRGTSADVERLCAEHLAERIANRKAFIADSLKAATERNTSRVAVPALEDSASSVDRLIEVTDASVAASTKPSTEVETPGRWRLGRIGLVMGVLAVGSVATFAITRNHTVAVPGSLPSVTASIVATTTASSAAAAALSSAPMPTTSAAPSSKPITKRVSAGTKPQHTGHDWGGIE